MIPRTSFSFSNLLIGLSQNIWSFILPRVYRKILQPFGKNFSGQLYLINADGSGTTQITTNEVGNDYDPQWSPDGELIAFTRFSYGQTKIYSVLPDGSGLAILTSSNGNDGIFDWAPDGRLSVVHERA